MGRIDTNGFGSADDAMLLSNKGNPSEQIQLCLLSWHFFLGWKVLGHLIFGLFGVVLGGFVPVLALAPHGFLLLFCAGLLPQDVVDGWLGRANSRAGARVAQRWSRLLFRWLLACHTCTNCVVVTVAVDLDLHIVVVFKARHLSTWLRLGSLRLFFGAAFFVANCS